MPRFSGFPHPEGLAILDGVTGEVVLIPNDGGPSRVLRDAIVADTRPNSEPGARSDAESVEVGPAPRKDLARLVPAAYPWPIAVAYQELIEATSAKERARLLVDVFTAVIKMWALQLSVEYLTSKGAHDPSLDVILGREMQRPLVSSWCAAIERALDALKAAGQAPFVSELAKAYPELHGRCADRLVIQRPVHDQHGEHKARPISLTKIEGLVYFRNRWAHGFVRSESAARKQLEVFLPVLEELLDASRFLMDYPLIGVARDAEGRAVRARRLMGVDSLHADIALEPSLPQGSSVFLRGRSGAAVLPLDVPFVYQERVDARELWLLDGFTKSTLLYTGVRGDLHETQEHARRWRALLGDKGDAVELVSASNLSLDGLRRPAARVSREGLDALTAAGVYLHDACIPRKALELQLEVFDRGDFRAFVIGGASGSGKSTTLAHYAADRLEAGDVVLFYRAAALADAQLTARIERDLGLARTRTSELRFDELLLRAGELFEGKEVRFRVLIDALDEYTGDVGELVRSLDALVAQIEPLSWFRVIVSVRRTVYERLAPRDRLGRLTGGKYFLVDEPGEVALRSLLVPLEPLRDAELEELYERMRAYLHVDPLVPDDPGVHLFRPVTPFAELDRTGSTRALLRNPLMLRIILAAHNGRPLPSELGYDEAMALYLDEVVGERLTSDTNARERLRMLKHLVRLLDAKSTAEIERDALYEEPALAAAMRRSDRNSPYVQLLELGVLSEGWKGATAWVRFSSERLFEYLLAERLSCERCEDVVRQAARARDFPNIGGALKVLANRAFREAREQTFLEALDSSELAGDTAAATLLEEVVASVLQQLARLDAPRFSALVEGLAGQSTARRARVLLAVVDALLLGTATDRAAEALGLAQRVAEALRAADTLGEVAMRQGQLSRRRGALDAAVAAFARAGDLAGETRNEELHSRAAIARADVLRLTGKLPEARVALEETVAALEKRRAFADAAEARRQLALVLESLQDGDAATAQIEQAIELAHKAGDASTLARCVSVAGIASWRRGDTDAAARLFADALAFAEQAGNVRLIAEVECNLGSLAYRDNRDLSEAMRHYQRYLDVSARSGDVWAQAVALHNLAIVARASGEPFRALPFATDAVALFEQVGDPKSVLVARNGLAATLGGCGRGNEALEELDRASSGARALGDADLLAESLWLLGNAVLLVEPPLHDRAEVITEELERAAEQSASPKHRAHAVALRIRLSARQSDGKRIRQLASELRALAQGSDLHLEYDELLTDAWLDAARSIVVDDVEGGLQLALLAEAELRGYHHPRASEVAVLRAAAHAHTAPVTHN